MTPGLTHEAGAAEATVNAEAKIARDQAVVPDRRRVGCSGRHHRSSVRGVIGVESSPAHATPQLSRGSRATVELLRAYTGPQPSSPRLRRPRDSLRRLGRGGRRAALTLMTVFGFYFGAASAGWVPPVTGPFLQAQ
jgi:hypothetical protein